MNRMMDRKEILNRLNELTSCYTFGRIITVIEYYHNKGILSNEELYNEQFNLLNQEISFLVGLWMYNIDMTQKGWCVKDDDSIVLEVYSLMNKLRKTYEYDIKKPTIDKIKEISFYEGDEGYDWQFIEFVEPKYSGLSSIIKDNFNYDTALTKFTYNKIKRYIEDQINRRLKIKRLKKEYVSFFNLYIISEKGLNKEFRKEEQNIIQKLSFTLGEHKASEIKDIGDKNEFHYKPILFIPKRGYLIVNILNLAIAMNELPYHWLMREGPKVNELGNLRGKAAEEIAFNILRSKYGSSCDIYKQVIINKNKSKRISDIDILYIKNNNAIIFQIKAKRLTELSKKGDVKSIDEDFRKAIHEAYDQGCKCVSCLKDYSSYNELEKIDSLKTDMNIYNICITLDQYPTISSIIYIKSEKIEHDDISLLAMSMYDFETIVYLFSEEELFEYIDFRVKCVKNKIYGMSEMYYIGAYLYKVFLKFVFPPNFCLENKYSRLADIIIRRAQYGKILVASLNDIRDEVLSFAKATSESSRNK